MSYLVRRWLEDNTKVSFDVAFRDVDSFSCEGSVVVFTRTARADISASPPTRELALVLPHRNIHHIRGTECEVQRGTGEVVDQRGFAVKASSVDGNDRFTAWCPGEIFIESGPFVVLFAGRQNSRPVLAIRTSYLEMLERTPDIAST